MTREEKIKFIVESIAEFEGVIDTTKNESKKHNYRCESCPFAYTNDKGEESCIFVDGFTHYSY